MSKSTGKRERPRQEHRDLNVRGVVLVAFGVIVTVLIVAAVGRFLTGVAGPARPAPTETAAAQPRYLSSSPLDPRAAFDREKHARLNSYGWIDREHGVVHVPIERAMQIRVARSARRSAP